MTTTCSTKKGREALDEFDRTTQLLSQHVLRFPRDEDIPRDASRTALLRIDWT